MDNQNHVTGNEKLEAEEQAIGEPSVAENYKPVSEMTNEEIDEISPVE